MRLAVCAIAALTVYVPSTVAAQEVGGAACKSPGNVALTNFPGVASELSQSDRKDVAGYARLAKANNCKVSVICVAVSKEDTAAYEFAGQQCSIVRRLMRGAVGRSWEATNIDRGRRTASGSRTAGTVYITLQ